MMFNCKFRDLERAAALVLLCVATAIALPAQTFTTLVKFDLHNGAYPSYMSLIQGTDGSLYGTTPGGGANNLGTAFKISPTGKVAVVHSFAAGEGTNPIG